MVKKIGILTSGGDCAGLNAVIRAVTLRATSEYGWKVYGLRDGTLGLMKDPIDAIELKTEHSLFFFFRFFLKHRQHSISNNKTAKYIN